MRFLVPLLVVSSFSLAAQPPNLSWPPSVPISTQEALAHRIGHDKPVYPRFALAAGISFTFHVPVSIWEDGTVHVEGPLTGPPSLIGSAQAWINSAKFRPFLRDGQAISVTTTLPIAFQVPPGAHTAHPPPALYQRNISLTIARDGPDAPPRVRWSAVSPAMRAWLARYQAAIPIADAPMQGNLFDSILARENTAPPLTQMPDNVVLYTIPLPVSNHRLYLLFEFSHGCAKSNCPIFLLDESSAGVQIVANDLGFQVDLHHRHDSPYPDLLFWSDVLRPEHSGISEISGFSYYGGQWGRLYCGTDDANEDFDRDEQIADRRRVPAPQPPLVTLCK
jgi:hypothetical protein